MTYLKTHTFGCGLVLAASLLGGCGSSGGSSDNNAAQSEISGSVFASYMEGASVSIYDTSGNLVAGPVTTNAQGGFTITLDTAHLASALIFKSTGGDFIDEVTGAVTVGGALSTLLASDTLAGSVDLSVNLTPSTTVVERLVSEHGKTLIEAQDAFENAFGFLPTPHILPSDATTTDADASDDQKLAGLRAAAFSQLNNDLGLEANQQFDLILQLADDLSDDSFDGKNDATDLNIDGISLGTDIKSKYSQSFIAFKESDKNKTALTNTQIGTLPFAQLALSENYKIQYVPGMMTSEGKATVKVKISDLEGTPATGLNPMLMPMMNMATHQHSTPKGSFVEDAEEDGTYIATIYFLMPSEMSNGMSMGYWDLKVSIGEESVHFYPPVMMAMGDTAKVKLIDQNDEIQEMGSEMMMPRPYFLFNNGLSAAGDNHDFSIFLATKDNMMSFPSLNDDSVIVEMSINQTDWTTATYSTQGIWTGNNLSGLAAGEDGTDIIYVKLTVNGVQATDDGNAPDEIADEAMFFVTPSSNMGMDM